MLPFDVEVSSVLTWNSICRANVDGSQHPNGLDTDISRETKSRTYTSDFFRNTTKDHVRARAKPQASGFRSQCLTSFRGRRPGTKASGLQEQGARTVMTRNRSTCIFLPLCSIW